MIYMTHGTTKGCYIHHLVREGKTTYIPKDKYSETSVHPFRWGSEKETMDPGKQ
jgi:hypothetical protein